MHLYICINESLFEGYFVFLLIGLKLITKSLDIPVLLVELHLQLPPNPSIQNVLPLQGIQLQFFFI
jgi:hypothetical protein